MKYFVYDQKAIARAEGIARAYRLHVPGSVKADAETVEEWGWEEAVRSWRNGDESPEYVSALREYAQALIGAATEIVTDEGRSFGPGRP